jgi:ZIP family zinc transporter
MHPAVFLPFFSTVAGGFAALRLRHRLHALMAVAAGVVVATAVADLLPEAMELSGEGGTLSIGIAAVVGFIGFSFLEAFLHQSSFEHEVDVFAREHEHGGRRGRRRARAEGSGRDVAGHDHASHDHERAPDADAPESATGQERTARRAPALIGILPPLSLVLHSAMDGLVIGFAFQAGDEIGLIVLLAVLAHDFADGMNVATVALEAARGERFAVGFVILDAVAAPFGGALSALISIDDRTLGLLLATFAGVFIAIGAGHLLPESQHRDPRRSPMMVSLAALGAAFALAVRAIAPA